jgi:ElaB/YqjD/DUF883 family membrane-anchored ribosome-binding protein
MFQPRTSEFDPRVSAIVDHLRAIEKELGTIGKIAGRRASSSLGTEAVQAGARVGNDALDRLGDQAKQRPLVTMGVALGIGMLIGFAIRWDRDD